MQLKLIALFALALATHTSALSQIPTECCLPEDDPCTLVAAITPQIDCCAPFKCIAVTSTANIGKNSLKTGTVEVHRRCAAAVLKIFTVDGFGKN
ncbi:hypothetical protein DFH08DRAFT_969953 [Mycena albidolilacea]|uniref:Extracellular membrane protein CFEM domain-containing protein n=1 Tax=Mycena albidolilacea TaxID=1033008 RepID=A0AAD6ZG37_9AGAR|nr:hypothetical protein DFH08DRAFT_969953 [Mycena albidolilacea]